MINEAMKEKIFEVAAEIITAVMVSEEAVQAVKTAVYQNCEGDSVMAAAVWQMSLSLAKGMVG